MTNDLTTAVADLDEQSVLSLAQARLDAGADPLAILNACREGMTAVGQLFHDGEYFISELIMAGAIFKRVALLVEPRLASNAGPSRGAVIIGSVKGDVHDIGKNLVVVLLKAAGYTIHDLGVDVPPQRFVDVLHETGATVLGLSALLTTSFNSMKATVDAVGAAGLRSKVRVMIGGGPVNESVQRLTGADAWGANAQLAVDLCNRWLKDESND